MPATIHFTTSPLSSPTAPSDAASRRRPPITFLTIPPPASLYQVLRVKETASPGEIKSAYRSLAKQLHPDVADASTASAGPDFMDVHRAYTTLSDPTAREKYDRSVGRVKMEIGGDLRMRRRRWETDQCW